jgi:hypothetical protein
MRTNKLSELKKIDIPILQKVFNHLSSNLTDPDNEIWEAADQYYKHLLDTELIEFQYVSALKYFDSEILSKLSPNKKIIHLRSFENEWLEKYNIKWQHGIEITPYLNSLVDKKTINAANHIYGEEKNQMLFESIQNVLENWDTIQLTKNPGIT